VVAYLESAFGGEVVVEGGAAGPERSFTRGRIRR
jgi:hypothetical protein